MSEAYSSKFSDEEIRPIDKDIPQKLHNGEVPRSQLDNELTWLCSRNHYVNPLNNQRFQVAIFTTTPEGQEYWQNQLLVAARAETFEENGQHNIDPIGVNDLSADPSEFSVTDDAVPGHVRIHIQMIDAAGVQPPYRVRFLLMPYGANLEDGGPQPSSEVPRTKIEPKQYTGRVHLPYTAKDITLYITALKITDSDSSIKARLKWSTGSNPAPTDTEPERTMPIILKDPPQAQELKGVPNVKGENYVLDVWTSGMVRYQIEGDTV